MLRPRSRKSTGRRTAACLGLASGSSRNRWLPISARALGVVLTLSLSPVWSAPVVSQDGQDCDEKVASIQAVSEDNPAATLEVISRYRDLVAADLGCQRTVVNLSRLLYRLGRAEEAFRASREFLDRFPESQKVRLNLAYLLQTQNRLQEARQEIDTVLDHLRKDEFETDPRRIYALHLLGRNLLGQEKFQEGEQYLLQVVTLDPGFVEARLNLAELYSQTPETYVQAVEHFESVIELRPEFAIAHEKLGKTLLDLARPEQAIRHLERAVQLDPERPEAYFLLAAAHRKHGDIETTREILSRFTREQTRQESERKRSTRGRSFYLEGVEQLGQGNLEAAVKAFEQAIENDPQLSEAHTGLAEAYLKQGHSLEALRATEKALESEPYESSHHYIRAVCLVRLDRVADGIEALETALTLNAQPAVYHNFSGHLHFTLGEYDEAIRYYRRAIEREPQHPIYHLNLSVALSKVGRVEESRRERSIYSELLVSRRDP